MNIDLKQYIISVLHFDLKLKTEEIQTEAVDLLFTEFSNDKGKISVDEIRRLYTELTSRKENTEATEKTYSEPVPEILAEPLPEISVSVMQDKPVEKKDTVIPKNIPGKPILLPNAKVNEKYQATLPLIENGLGGIMVLNISGLEEVGLQSEPNGLIIAGIPKVAGDFSFVMEYKHKEESENRPSLHRKLSIYINPDPRSLWVEIEPDPESLFPKTHIAHSELQYHEKEAVGASKRGRSHAKDAKFRDDHFEMMVDPASDWLAITVSDGAGSAKYSREGSKIFCQTVLAEIFSGDNRKHLDAASKFIEEGDAEQREKELKKELYFLIGNALLKSYKEVEETANLNAAVVKDFSCTFIVSLIKKVRDGWFIIGFWVGDGGIGIYFEDKEPQILGQPDSGEFSGQTRFITMPEILKNAEEIFGRIKVSRVDDFKGLVLMTDGISDAWFHTDANLFKKEKWDELWLDIQSKRGEKSSLNSIELLEWLDFWVKGEYDDRTIVILQ